jgi:hypothetical protein
MKFLSRCGQNNLLLALDKSPRESVNLSGKTARGETGATASGGEPGGKPREAASITPIFATLSRIKSVIGIKYPKIKFFWKSSIERTIPRVIRPRRRLARVHEDQTVGKWFPVNAALDGESI